MLHDKTYIHRRWNEYFNDLFNVGTEDLVEKDKAETSDIKQDEKDNIPITLEEIKKALNNTKNNKAPGPDNIQIEVIRAEGEELVEYLHVPFNSAYEHCSGISQSVRITVVSH